MPLHDKVRNALTIISLAAVVIMTASLNSAYQNGMHDGSKAEAQLCATY